MKGITGPAEIKYPARLDLVVIVSQITGAAHDNEQAGQYESYEDRSPGAPGNRELDGQESDAGERFDDTTGGDEQHGPGGQLECLQCAEIA